MSEEKDLREISREYARGEWPDEMKESFDDKVIDMNRSAGALGFFHGYQRSRTETLDQVNAIINEVIERVKAKRKESPGLSLASAAILDIQASISRLKEEK